MLRVANLTVILAALMLVGQPVQAQPAPDSDPPALQLDSALVGMPIISSDGQKVGQVAEVGLDAGEPILIGEFEMPLGIGATSAAVPAEMMVPRGDHVELTITVDELHDRLANSQR